MVVKEITLEKYGPIISDKEDGIVIHKIISDALQKHGRVDINLNGIVSMATFCAKQIFGSLYIKLGADSFFDCISFSNASDDVKSIIMIGIQNALDDSEKK